MAETDQKDVRIGIIGPSWWVDYWHLPALLHHPRARIIGIAGEKARSPQEVAAKYGESVRYFTRASDMLDETHPDGVVVCTPNDLHFPSTMAALERGIHVICEKPLALDSDQARLMTETAKESGLIGMTNFPYRANPCVLAFRQLLAGNAVGEMVHFTGEYHGGFGLRGWPGSAGSSRRAGSVGVGAESACAGCAGRGSGAVVGRAGGSRVSAARTPAISVRVSATLSPLATMVASSCSCCAGTTRRSSAACPSRMRPPASAARNAGESSSNCNNW